MPRRGYDALTTTAGLVAEVGGPGVAARFVECLLTRGRRCMSRDR